MQSTKKIAVYTLVGIASLEAFSFFTFLSPALEPWLFGAVALAAIGLTVKKLEYGILLLFVELIIGSFGRMLEFNISGFDISLRIALWFVVLAVWLVQIVIAKGEGITNRILFLKSSLFKPYLILAVVLGWGIVWGIVRGNNVSAVFFDVNNYLYFALVFPLYEIFSTRIKTDLARIGTIIMSAITWLSIKTIALFYIFSHELFGLQDVLYAWSRKMQLAEITNVDPTIILSRVFMQSQIWVLFGLFVLLGVLSMSLRGALYSGRRGNLIGEKGTDTRIHEKEPYATIRLPRFGVPLLAMTLSLIILFTTALITSFSRSFWLASILAFGFLLLLLLLTKEKFRTIAIFTGVSAICIVLSVGLFLGVAAFPIPQGTASGDFLKNRAGKFSGEAAANSRVAQIRPLLESIKTHPVWGSGFGTSVTYYSQDPRVLKNHPDGQYTTTAFELGWLEMWLKIGLVGVAAYLYLLCRIIKFGWKKFGSFGWDSGHSDRYLILGALVGLFAVVVTHGISPYLNHPLGIGIIILLTILVDKTYKNQ